MKVYYDANGVVLGRIGSVICKELLKGKEVAVINCEKSIITGNRQEVLATLLHWRNLGGLGLKGPRTSKIPERMFKRMIRGMLPWDRTRGREVYRKLMCYSGNGDLNENELKQVKKIETKKVLKSVTLGELCKTL